MHVLGSGGFADVFLYEQNMPRRQVAVKVMLSEVVNDQVRQMFQAEANLMAQLSAHPSILTVYQAGVSSDGRPYLVMELCSAVLSDRYRREPLPVPEVLRIAVRIGSAIETAHRAGVLHRDIKPSNILTTAYGHPVLSDFGIAATLSEAKREESVGLSIPWSAPEVLMDETSGTVASEVWSLAATVYSLLAGRSPFEIPDGKNSSSDLMARINRAKPQPIGRPDVPASLEKVLATAMSKKPEHRPTSILELVRELQAIETELGVPQTAVEVAMDDWALGGVAEAEEKTLLRGVPGAAPVPAARKRRRAAASSGHTGGQGGAVILESEASSPNGPVERPAAKGPMPRATLWAAIAGAVLVLSLAAVTTMLLLRGSSSDIPVVSNIAATETAGGTVEFSWADPGISAADTYQIAVTGGASSIQRSPDFVVDAEAGDRVCITVTVNRGGKTGPSSTEKCVDVQG
ncbi:serine/threonine-protein kinase [Lysobacter korlensis]|uniref:Serine/threonine-protein kinase n=1 Tax=Lysobacter korlensis TaxID=553636 RepID=A0ABV6RZT4_9GAMM